MQLGFSMGVDRGVRFVNIDEYVGDTIKNSLVFPQRNWTRFVLLLPQIEDCLMNHEIIEFKQQVSGTFFLSVVTCFNHVIVCGYFFNPINGSGPEVIANMTIPLAEWAGFKAKICLINEQFTTCDNFLDNFQFIPSDFFLDY
jgi:hypothetical protein